jgi:hypothetical protein
MTATISTGTIGGRDKYGTATVTVTDDLGNPVAGATVQVRFTGDFGDLISASTDASGSTTVTTSTALRRPNFSACVVSLSFGGLTYVPGSEACPAP